jgi:hypothetical protein
MCTLVTFVLPNRASSMLHPSKVSTKIYIISSAHIAFRISMSLIQETRPPEGQQCPSWCVPHSLDTSALELLYF